MKSVVEKLLEKNMICKKLELLDNSKIGTRKKIDIYFGVDVKSYYCLVLKLAKKSRVVKKEASEIVAIATKVEELHGAKIKKKYIIIEAPLCSKAKKLLEENGFIVLL